MTAAAERQYARVRDRALCPMRLARDEQAVALAPGDRDRHGDLMAAGEALTADGLERFVEPGRIRKRVGMLDRSVGRDPLRMRGDLAERELARERRAPSPTGTRQQSWLHDR